jgi:hypothetical protein
MAKTLRKLGRDAMIIPDTAVPGKITDQILTCG